MDPTFLFCARRTVFIGVGMVFHLLNLDICLDLLPTAPLPGRLSTSLCNTRGHTPNCPGFPSPAQNQMENRQTFSSKTKGPGEEGAPRNHQQKFRLRKWPISSADWQKLGEDRARLGESQTSAVENRADEDWARPGDYSPTSSLPDPNFHFSVEKRQNFPEKRPKFPRGNRRCFLNGVFQSAEFMVRICNGRGHQNA